MSTDKELFKDIRDQIKKARYKEADLTIELREIEAKLLKIDGKIAFLRCEPQSEEQQKDLAEEVEKRQPIAQDYAAVKTEFKELREEIERLLNLFNSQKQVETFSLIQSDLITQKKQIEQKRLELKILNEQSITLETVLVKNKLELSNIKKLIYNNKAIKKENEKTLIRSESKLKKEKKALDKVQDRIEGLQEEVTELEEKRLELEEKLEIELSKPPSSSRDKQILRFRGEIEKVQSKETWYNEKLLEKETGKNVIISKLNLLKQKIATAIQRVDSIKPKLTNLEDQLLEKKETEKVLKEQKKELDSTFSTSTKDFQNLLDKQEELIAGFAELLDPSLLISQFDDNTPILLLPVRVETRFMTIKHVKRVVNAPVPPIPNETAVVFLEDVRTELKENEKTDTKQSTLEKLAGHQVPKPVEILTDEAIPVVPDQHELWVRIFPDDLSIHTHEERLGTDELEAGRIYWTETWRAGDGALKIHNQEFGAWRVLSSAYGPQRAAWIALQTTPTNPGDKPATPVDADDPLPVEPILPTLILRPSNWTEKAVSRVMPDLFVVRGYTGKNSFIEVIGNQIPDPLPLGMEPDSLNDDFEQVNRIVDFPADIKWMTNFEEAEKIGMGIRIPLDIKNAKPGTAQCIEGFNRLFVLGIKFSADKTEATRLLEELIDNHHYTDGGFALIPQGTPTNNTEDATAGYSATEIGAEESYNVERKEPLYTLETDPLLKTDGQRFCELLGISTDKLEHIQYANGTDWKESFAMNAALWPATMGYYLEQVMTPVISSNNIKSARQFYCDFVHGRGHIPSFRVDNQPYGVLLMTAFSKWEQSGAAVNEFSDRLFKNVLKPMNTQWGVMANTVANACDLKGLDPQEAFLEMLGLHASSVEFYQRFTAGSYLAWNLKQFVEGHINFTGALDLPKLDGRVPNFAQKFKDLEFNFSGHPRIFGMLFLQEQRLLDGPLIDSLSLSENRRIENFPSTQLNYIEWLIQSSLTEIRYEDFSKIPDIESGQAPPQALLYLLLRQACFLEYLNTSYLILEQAALINPEDRVELEFISDENGLNAEEEELVRSMVTADLSVKNELKIATQVGAFQQKGNPSEEMVKNFTKNVRQSFEQAFELEVDQQITDRIAGYNADRQKWNYLTNDFGDVTNGKPMMDFIVEGLRRNSSNTEGLKKMKAALSSLKDTPTAKLERCFTEHLDTCNYRLDAWMLGLVNERLHQQQLSLGGTKTPGPYLGAYGMLENVYPGAYPGIHVEEIPTTVDKKTNDFIYLGKDPFTQLQQDAVTGRIVGIPRVNPENQGYIHAPSMNHAVTAAILRAGYSGHANTLSPDDALAVNLSSARVRKAMYYLEGIRNGQTLPAMLGYQFERSLHDLSQEDNTIFKNTAGNVELDKYILDIRRAYPLVAGNLTSSGNDIRNSEANNVVDGLRLVEVYRKSLDGGPDWFDAVSGIPTVSLVLITDQIKVIADHMDAVGDLALAESMYQVTQGNHERAGAMMKAITEGNNPPIPQIVKTPRIGNVLTNRVAIHFDTMIGTATAWSSAATPRSITEPNVNAWLANLLPSPDKVCVNVEYTTYDVSGEDLVQTAKLQLTVLNIQPIDFIHILNVEKEGGDASELSQRIGFYIKRNLAFRDDKPVKLFFMDLTGFAKDEVSIFELTPLVLNLSKLIADSRALTPDDFMLANDAAENEIIGIDTTNLEARLEEAIGPSSTTGQQGMVDIVQDLDAANIAAKTITDFTASSTDVATLNALRDNLLKASNFGKLGTIPSTAYQLSEVYRDDLTTLADQTIEDFNQHIQLANDIMTALATSSSEQEKATNLTKVAQILFGRAFKIFPEFTIPNQTDYEFALLTPDLLVDAGDFPIEEWMHGVIRVKLRVACLHQSLMLAEIFGNEPSSFSIAQLPLHPTGDDRWLGTQFPDDYEIPGDTLSLIMDLPNGYDSNSLQAGIMLEEWTEQIPDRNAITGIAMNFDQPNTEAPQTVLLAVTPKQTGSWDWNDLMDILDETLQMAKKRAVEPDIFNQTIFAQTLPAIMSPISGSDSTPSLDFSRNVVEANSGQVGPIDVDAYSAGSAS